MTSFETSRDAEMRSLVEYVAGQIQADLTRTTTAGTALLSAMSVVGAALAAGGAVLARTAQPVAAVCFGVAAVALLSALGSIVLMVMPRLPHTGPGGTGWPVLLSAPREFARDVYVDIAEDPVRFMQEDTHTKASILHKKWQLLRVACVQFLVGLCVSQLGVVLAVAGV